jgi:trk system potassium uptake protein TrkA
VRMDARDRETLKAQGIHEVDAAVVCMGEDFEAAEVAAVHLTDLGCPHVIVRGTTRERVEILDALGPKVINPGMAGARQLAVRLVSPGLREYASFVGGHQVAEVVVPASLDGHTLGDLRLAKTARVHVLALRRGLTADTELVVGPGDGHPLRTGDNLLLLGAEADLIRAGERFA